MRLRSSPGLPRIDGSSVNPCHCQSIKYLKLSKCFIGAMQWNNEQNCEKTAGAEKCLPGRSIVELTTWWIQPVSEISNCAFLLSLILAFKKGCGQLVGAALELSTSALSQSLGSIVQPNRSIWESSSFFYRS